MTSGLLDTSAIIDLPQLSPLALPTSMIITTVSLAELHLGVAVAPDPLVAAARRERLIFAMTAFAVLPFDTDAATRFGSLVARIVATGRSPRPRRLDLMIAAIASVHALPLLTRNSADFAGLEPDVQVVPL